jgi:hypothetical protein
MLELADDGVTFLDLRKLVLIIGCVRILLIAVIDSRSIRLFPSILLISLEILSIKLNYATDHSQTTMLHAFLRRMNFYRMGQSDGIPLQYLYLVLLLEILEVDIVVLDECLMEICAQPEVLVLTGNFLILKVFKFLPSLFLHFAQLHIIQVNSIPNFGLLFLGQLLQNLNLFGEHIDENQFVPCFCVVDSLFQLPVLPLHVLLLVAQILDLLFILSD